MKKYLAEMVGTFVLTLLGCGTAVSLACGSDTASVVGTAVKGNVVPRAYNLAHGGSILNAVVDAVVAGELGGVGVGVFIHTIDGVAHQRYLIGCASGTIRPR